MTESTESTALTLAERKDLEARLVDYDLTVAGEEHLQPGDIGMPPRLRISQPNRPIEIGTVEAEPGSIVNTLTGDVGELLEIVPIVYLPRTRVMWPAKFDAGNNPVCVSDDGKIPAESSDNRQLDNPQPGPCKSCPYSQFGPDGEPPVCKAQRNFLVMIFDGDKKPEPAILTFQSTALKGARHLTTLAKTQGLLKTVKFATMEVKDDRGRWFVPVFSKGSILKFEEIIALAEARDELKNLIEAEEFVVTADVAEEMRENGQDAETEDLEPEFLPEYEDESIPF